MFFKQAPNCFRRFWWILEVWLLVLKWLFFAVFPSLVAGVAFLHSVIVVDNLATSCAADHNLVILLHKNPGYHSVTFHLTLLLGRAMSKCLWSLWNIYLQVMVVDLVSSAFCWLFVCLFPFGQFTCITIAGSWFWNVIRVIMTPCVQATWMLGFSHLWLFGLLNGHGMVGFAGTCWLFVCSMNLVNSHVSQL